MIVELFLNRIVIPECCKMVNVAYGIPSSADSTKRIYQRSAHGGLFNVGKFIEIGITGMIITIQCKSWDSPSIVNDCTVFDLNDPVSTPEAVSNVLNVLIERHLQ